MKSNKCCIEQLEKGMVLFSCFMQHHRLRDRTEHTCSADILCTVPSCWRLAIFPHNLRESLDHRSIPRTSWVEVLADFVLQFGALPVLKNQSMCDKVVCERWCVTKLCVKDGVAKDGVWQSCVRKMVWWKVGCDKVVCERWCGERLCVKDGVWKMVLWKMVCDKVVCEGWCGERRCGWKFCVKESVWQSCVWKMVCVTASCERWCVKDGV